MGYKSGRGAAYFSPGSSVRLLFVCMHDTLAASSVVAMQVQIEIPIFAVGWSANNLALKAQALAGARRLLGSLGVASGTDL